MGEDSLAPLCIILVKSGAHGGKLLFKYPFPSYSAGPAQPASPGGQATPQPRHNPYAVRISEDLLSQREERVEPSNIQSGTLVGLSDETLGDLFSVSKRLCGSKFELKLNDVRFVGHPVWLETEGARRTTLTMFHIVFALRAVAAYSVVACYHELSQRLGLILQHEEQRVSYLTQQMRSLIAAQDEVGTLPEDQQEHPFSLATERSHLARDIRTIYQELCTTGEVRIYINKWVELSFCLPHKLHRRNFPDIEVEPETIFSCLEELRPYHALLLLQDPQDLLDSLSTDASPAMRRLVRHASPLQSLAALAVDTDLSLAQVFQLTGHLLYWARATVIYPVCESNLYVVSPRLPAPPSARLRETFSDKFSESLLDSLATFSLPCRVAVSPPLALHQHRMTEMITWLLQHHLVIQLHTFVSLALDPELSCLAGEDPSPDPGPASLPSPGEPGETGGQQPGPHELLAGFSRAEQAAILAVPAASDPASLAQFARLSRYFRGNHHLEEVMHRENCSRHELLQCIDKFSSILIKHEHEDPAVSRYWT